MSKATSGQDDDSKSAVERINENLIMGNMTIDSDYEIYDVESVDVYIETVDGSSQIRFDPVLEHINAEVDDSLLSFRVNYRLDMRYRGLCDKLYVAPNGDATVYDRNRKQGYWVLKQGE